MVFKNTDDLGSELLSQPNLDKYLKSNQTSFFDWDISELLSRLYEKKIFPKPLWPGAPTSAKFTSTKYFLDVGFPPETACCAFALVYRPLLRKHKPCSNRQATPNYTSGINGTLLFTMD